MAKQLPFQRLISADWSTGADKRWLCAAERRGDGWLVSAPAAVGDTARFVDGLFTGPVLVGFDFPIGLPEAYGAKTGFRSFTEALDAFGSGAWKSFYEVAETAEQISVHRPFYPRVSRKGCQPVHITSALGLSAVDQLRRRCEQATSGRQAACALFWTLGGNQVGKAAISGWQSVVQPARQRGAKLWPFDGTLEELASAGAPVVAEIYPGEAYGHVGISFRGGRSKRRQEDRAAQAAVIRAWCNRAKVGFADGALAQVNDGFGTGGTGEDAFDAFLGLLSMIEVADGSRAAGPQDADRSPWEGWILGQAR